MSVETFGTIAIIAGAIYLAMVIRSERRKDERLKAALEKADFSNDETARAALSYALGVDFIDEKCVREGCDNYQFDEGSDLCQICYVDDYKKSIICTRHGCNKKICDDDARLCYEHFNERNKRFLARDKRNSTKNSEEGISGISGYDAPRGISGLDTPSDSGW